MRENTQSHKDVMTPCLSDATYTDKQPLIAHSNRTLQERSKEWDGKRYQSTEIDWGIPVGKEL